jgi:hypothetical protein
MSLKSLLRTILKPFTKEFTNNSKSNTTGTANWTQTCCTNEYCGNLKIEDHNFVMLSPGLVNNLDITDEFATILQPDYKSPCLGLISDLTGVEAYPILQQHYFWQQDQVKLLPGIYDVYGPVASDSDQWFLIQPRGR